MAPPRAIPPRKAPEATAQRHPFAFVAFSAGPRKCAGDDFALLESLLIITMLLQRYHVSLLPNQNFQARLGASRRPKYGVKATFSVRDQRLPSPE